MKPIEKKLLFQAGRSGNADISAIREKLYHAPLSKKPKVDDREPEERMADEFEKLSLAIQSMNKAQSDRFLSLMQSMIESIKKMESIGNKPQDRFPVKVDVVEKKKEWIIEVDATRDERGLVEYPYNIRIRNI